MPGHAASWCVGYPEVCPYVSYYIRGMAIKLLLGHQTALNPLTQRQTLHST